MIQAQSVQKVLDTALIEEVVGEYVRLKRSGANLKGLSPFTNEKTPSFIVSPTKQIFKCFSSGKGGNVASFLMEVEQMSFVESIRWLAKKYNITLEETKMDPSESEELKHRESLFIVNEFAKRHFTSNLWDTDQGKAVGLSYLKERGILEHTIRKFELGFALPGRQALRAQAEKEGHSSDYLKELGLLNKSGNDFFYERVMFTICDTNGRPIAFAGRVMGKSDEGVKYINSPESPVYHKTHTLYGIHLAKEAIRKNDECILVEGYLDLIALHQAGINNVVASSGTALTSEQIKLIKRYTQRICILYDADPAGIKAALRGADLMLEQGADVLICLLPEGQDPDDFIRRNGYQAFIDYKSANQKDIIAFRIQQLLLEAGTDPIKKTGLIQALLETLARIPDAIKRAVFVQASAQRLQMEESVLVSELNKLIKKNNYLQQRRNLHSNPKEAANLENQTSDNQEDTADIPNVQDPLLAPERDVLRVLMAYGKQMFEYEGEQITALAFILAHMEDVLETVSNEQHRAIFQFAMESWKYGEIPESSHYTGHIDPKIAILAIELLMTPYEYSENWEIRHHLYLETQPHPDKNVEKDAEQAMLRYKFGKVAQQCRLNQQKLELLVKSDPDSEEILKLIKVHKKLLDYRNQIATRLGTVVW
jgi:DNA primase